MSLIQQYAEMEAQMKAIREKMEKLMEKGGMEQELKFKEELDTLMEKYGKSPTETIDILAPYSMTYKGKQVGVTASSYNGGRVRRPRKTRVYKNPLTNEVAESRGGNHKLLRAWKEEHGEEEVNSWLIREISADGTEVSYEKEGEEEHEES